MDHIPTNKLIKALLAIAFGTIIEWYDFTIYTQLTGVMSKVFFPGSDPAVQALSIWGIFAVGFISRPVGALLFGHMGDTKGRGLCLLLSVILMGVPTVIIGCLPAYKHIGIAAPVLLAIMRLIQGLAMGGEFGAAMVYLHEIARPEYKSVTGSLGYVSLGIGVVLGILVVAAVIYTVTGDAMLTWGWRVPFLLAIITLVAAIALRYNMPESQEFIVSRDEIAEEAQRRKKKNNNKKGSSSGRDTDMVCDVTSSEDGSMVKASVQPHKDLEAGGGKGAGGAPGKHYVPVLELFRGHWVGILVQTCYEAWIGAGFYQGYSWLPSFFTKHAGIPQSTTLWMTLSSMVLFTFVVPLAGWLSDKGVGRVTATMVMTFIATATAIPMFLGFATKSLALCWVLQAVILALVAYTMGVLPAICSNIYPAGVRISGFNFAYNFGIMTFGGLTPLIMTAIQTNSKSIYIGPGIWMSCMGVVTMVSCLLLLKWFPATNK